MLRTTIPPQALATNKVLGAEVLAADEIGDIEGGSGSNYMKSKTRKSTKSKNLSKSGNFPKIANKEAGLSSLTSGAKTAFNRLWLAFTKAPFL